MASPKRRSRLKRLRSDHGRRQAGVQARSQVMPGIALVAAVLLLSPGATWAQAWPSRPVTVMVPFPAGGTADLLARGVAQALNDALSQPFVIENRAGASGNLAAGAVARAAPDGSSLL